MSLEPNKYGCTECYWRGSVTEALTAPNPFDSADTIWGCPDCHVVNKLLLLCDEPGCGAVTTCGTPTEDGYRQTCGRHAPVTTYSRTRGGKE
jgi:hypothetical protein